MPSVVGPASSFASCSALTERSGSGSRRAVRSSSEPGRTAVGVTDVADLAGGPGQRVVHGDATEQRVTDARQQLERLGGHHRPADGAHCRQHARDLAGVFGGVGLLGEEVPVVDTALIPRDADLRRVAQGRAPHQRDRTDCCRIVGQVAGVEVVAAVDDEVGIQQQVERGSRREPDVVAHDRDIGCQRGQGICRRIDLRTADIGGGVEGLPVQVGGVDGVVVDDRDGADARRRERGQDCAAEAARADRDDVGVRETFLRLDAETVQDALPGVALILRVHGHGAILPPWARSAFAATVRA